MNKTVLCMLTLLLIKSAMADDQPLDLAAFAQRYFAAMVASQAPDAGTEDLEAYLALLVDDVGHSHLPWETDDTRLPDGKAAMRKGMSFYLGAHTEYQAELLDVFTFNDSAIAIRYRHHAKGIHPQNKQAIEYQKVMMDVLELEGNKVAVIRKYHE